MKIYVVDNEGRITTSQDTTLGEYLTREEALKAIEWDWNYLTKSERAKIGSEYVLRTYDLPDDMGTDAKAVYNELVLDDEIQPDDAVECEVIDPAAAEPFTKTSVETTTYAAGDDFLVEITRKIGTFDVYICHMDKTEKMWIEGGKSYKMTDEDVLEYIADDFSDNCAKYRRLYM